MNVVAPEPRNCRPSPDPKETGLPMKKEAGQLNQIFRLVLEMESQARANQMLPQIVTLVGFDLGARIIQELIFNKRAEFWSEIVICAGNNLPGEV